MEKIDLSCIDLDSFRDSFKKNSDNFKVSYNAKRDILLIQLNNPPPAISVDCDGLFWLRINPENHEVIGVEIEGYRKVFLKRCRELERMRPSSNKPFVDRISKELVGCLS
jgi:hypothetical protein